MIGNKKNTKLLVLVLIMALLVGCTIGGTLAWLVTETEPVVNTFTVGNISLTLTEENPEVVDGQRSAQMVPGTAIAKNPKVTVGANSEDCWVFVKIEKTGGNITVGESTSQKTYTFNDFIKYEVRNDENEWQAVIVEGVNYELYARKVTTNTDAQSFYVLKDISTPNTDDDFDNGCVKIFATVTKEMMDEIDKNPGQSPKLTFTAYAIQSEGLKKADDTAVKTALEAWEVYNNLPQ